jgi:flagellar biosynthetic protein FliR
VPVFSEFLNLLMLSVFVVTGGHQYLLDALLQGFQQMPPGTAHIPPSLVEALINITTFSFAMGLRMAAPIMVALLLSLVITGLISRTLPQLNILSIGFSINSTVMLGAMLLSLGVLARVFQEQSFATIDMIRPVFMHPTP